MPARTFIDTNVLVHAVDNADPTKQRRAQRILEPADDELVLSAQVLSEFYTVVTRKLAVPLAPKDAQAMVDALARLPTVAVTAELVRAAIAASQEWQLSYWDALVLRSAESAGCERLLTEDLADRSTYGTIRVENPFG